MSRSRGPRRGPSGLQTLTDANQLKMAFVLLIGLSSGLIALQSDASLEVITAAMLGGFVAGSALLWYLLWITTD